MSLPFHLSSRLLLPKINSTKNLRKAFHHIRLKGGDSVGTDGETINEWTKRLHEYLLGLYYDLNRLEDYDTSPIKEVHIASGGRRRRIAILCLRDRVVSRACYQVLSEVFDSKFNNNNFAYRPRRNRSQAASSCQQLIRSGRKFWVKADIKDCFGCIQRRRLNGLIRLLMRGEIVLGHLLMRFAAMERRPRGIVQGGNLSPFFANLYLDSVDWSLAEKGLLFAHYGDDFVIACNSKKEAQEALSFLDSQLQKIGLQLNDKTRVIELSQDHRLNFCGFEIFDDDIAVSKQSVKRMQKKAFRLVGEFFDGPTKIVGDWNKHHTKTEAMKFLFSRTKSEKRKSERKRNQILRKHQSVTYREGKLTPKYLWYLKSWCEQHEIVDFGYLAAATEPVLDYAQKLGDFVA